jgi:hypothetical protein
MQMINQKEISHLIDEKDMYSFECPHCDCLIIVKEAEINCQIFRHGIFKSTGQQIPPHSLEVECKLLLDQNAVYGCCKPFKFIRKTNGIPSHVEKCDWI